eukprot:SAG22_NODE_8415_length_658_cov_1.175313_2_plen_77_part_01
MNGTLEILKARISRDTQLYTYPHTPGQLLLLGRTRRRFFPCQWTPAWILVHICRCHIAAQCAAGWPPARSAPAPPAG